jgi:hypothetical protein
MGEERTACAPRQGSKGKCECEKEVDVWASWGTAVLRPYTARS